MKTVISLLVIDIVRFELDARARNPGFWFGLEYVWCNPNLAICLMMTVGSLLVSNKVMHELEARARNPFFCSSLE